MPIRWLRPVPLVALDGSTRSSFGRGPVADATGTKVCCTQSHLQLTPARTAVCVARDGAIADSGGFPTFRAITGSALVYPRVPGWPWVGE